MEPEKCLSFPVTTDHDESKGEAAEDQSVGRGFRDCITVVNGESNGVIYEMTVATATWVRSSPKGKIYIIPGIIISVQPSIEVGVCLIR